MNEITKTEISEIERLFRRLPGASFAFTTHYGESIVVGMDRTSGPDVRLTFARNSVTLTREDVNNLEDTLYALLDLSRMPQ